jgi:hypothetical protein
MKIYQNYKDALEMMQNLNKGNQLVIVQQLNNMAVSYERLGDDKKPIEYYKNALLEMRRNVIFKSFL